VSIRVSAGTSRARRWRPGPAGCGDWSPRRWRRVPQGGGGPSFALLSTGPSPPQRAPARQRPPSPPRVDLTVARRGGGPSNPPECAPVIRRPAWAGRCGDRASTQARPRAGGCALAPTVGTVLAGWGLTSRSARLVRARPGGCPQVPESTRQRNVAPAARSVCRVLSARAERLASACLLPQTNPCWRAPGSVESFLPGRITKN